MGNDCLKPNYSNKFDSPANQSVRQNMLHNTQRRDVFKYYEVLRTLGEGSMGSIKEVRKKVTAVGGSAYKPGRSGKFGRFGRSTKVPESVVRESERKTYALKSIILSRVSNEFMEELRNEISILEKLDHPNIVKAYEVYETKVNIYIVLENCSGGDLFTRGPYSEKSSAKIIGKLLSAILHMHNHNITHRDLKFENVMFESTADDAEIKLIDFGLAKKCDPKKSTFMSAGVGTLYTIAPEVFSGVYTSQVDMWSIGVMAYMLLASAKPFHEKRRSQMIAKIRRGEYKFNPRRWENVSEESKDFVKSLIVVQPKMRLSAEKAMNHNWLSDEFPLSDRIPSESVMDKVKESIIEYGKVGEFKKLALMVIAHKSSSDEILELRKAFDAYDTANDGVINLEEFKAVMENSATNYSAEDIKKVFFSLDTGKDGKIYYTEFLAATLEAQGRIVEETIASAFDRIDSDDTGYISRENLRDFLGKDFTEERVNELLAEGDITGDGKISFEEFMQAFRKKNSKKALRLVDSDDSLLV